MSSRRRKPAVNHGPKCSTPQGSYVSRYVVPRAGARGYSRSASLRPCEGSNCPEVSCGRRETIALRPSDWRSIIPVVKAQKMKGTAPDDSVNYHINLFWNDETACWIADIPDLKFCSAHGETADEALREFIQTKEVWLASARAHRQSSPKPRYRPAI